MILVPVKSVHNNPCVLNGTDKQTVFLLLDFLCLLKYFNKSSRMVNLEWIKIPLAIYFN